MISRAYGNPFIISIFVKCLKIAELKKKKQLKNSIIRPNKKISVFRVTGMKILGRVGTHIFF